MPEIFSAGCGMILGAVFVLAVPVVDGVGRGVLVVEGAVDGLAGAVAGSVAVDGRTVLLVGAPAARVLEGRVAAVVDSTALPQPLMSAPPASAAITDVDSLGNIPSPGWKRRPLTCSERGCASVGPQTLQMPDASGARSRETRGFRLRGTYAFPPMPNINNALFDEPREHPGFRCLRARLSRQAASRRLGLSLWEAPSLESRRTA